MVLFVEYAGFYLHLLIFLLNEYNVLESVALNRVCFQSAILLFGVHWEGLYNKQEQAKEEKNRYVAGYFHRNTSLVN